MGRFTVFGVEEVYDAFDSYEHANRFPPFSVEADSVEEAKKIGSSKLWKIIRHTRKEHHASGDFVPKVVLVANETGEIVLDQSNELVRSWPWKSDERNQIPVVFLAYNSNDIVFANALASSLAKHGFLLWFAPFRPDMPTDTIVDDIELRETIADGIQCTVVMLIGVSNSAIESNWVSFEVGTAIDSHGRGNQPQIIGLQIESLTSNVAWLDALQSNHEVRDFSDWSDELLFEGLVKSLIGDLKQIFGSRYNIGSD